MLSMLYIRVHGRHVVYVSAKTGPGSIKFGQAVNSLQISVLQQKRYLDWLNNINIYRCKDYEGRWDAVG